MFRGIPRFQPKTVVPRNTRPPSPWNLTSKVLYMSPHLAESELSYTRLPHSVVTFVSAPLFSDTNHPPACKPEEARGICNNVDRAQSVMYHPAASYRDGPSLPVLAAAPSAGTAAATKAAGSAPRHRSVHPKDVAPLLSGGTNTRDMEMNVSPRAQYHLNTERRARTQVTLIRPSFWAIAPVFLDIHAFFIPSLNLFSGWIPARDSRGKGRRFTGASAGTWGR